jgi:hypothetical protein
VLGLPRFGGGNCTLTCISFFVDLNNFHIVLSSGTVFSWRKRYVPGSRGIRYFDSTVRKVSCGGSNGVPHISFVAAFTASLAIHPVSVSLLPLPGAL